MVLKSSRERDLLDAADSNSNNCTVELSRTQIPRWLASVLRSSASDLVENEIALNDRHGRLTRRKLQHTEDFLPGRLGGLTKVFLSGKAGTDAHESPIEDTNGLPFLSALIMAALGMSIL